MIHRQGALHEAIVEHETRMLEAWCRLAAECDVCGDGWSWAMSCSKFDGEPK